MNKQISKNWDGVTGFFAILFGLVYGYITYTTPKTMFGDPLDHLYFPYGIACLSIFLGIILIIKGGIAPSIEAIKELIGEDKIKKLDRRMVLYTCIVCIAYALTFEHLGYIISTFIFLFAVLSLTNGIKSWKINSLVAILFSICIYLLFAKALGISLPPLPFEIGGEAW